MAAKRNFPKGQILIKITSLLSLLGYAELGNSLILTAQTIEIIPFPSFFDIVPGELTDAKLLLVVIWKKKY
jgi:hypothetical protein